MIDPKALMRLFSGENTIMVWGPRKSGKTHMVVRLMYDLIKIPHVHVITNILFKKRTGPGWYDFVKEYPPGIIEFERFSDIWRQAAPIKKRDHDAVFVVCWDEMMKSVGKYDTMSPLGKLLARVLADSRKMDICFVAMSQYRNDFISQIKDEAGNAALFKDQAMTYAYNEEMGRGFEPKDLAFVMMDTLEQGGDAVWRIDGCEWTRPKMEIGIGEYIYDHRSSAAVYIDDMWEDAKYKKIFITEFMRVYRSIEEELPDRLIRYFAWADEYYSQLTGDEEAEDEVLSKVNWKREAVRVILEALGEHGTIKIEPKGGRGTVEAELNQSVIARLVGSSPSSVQRWISEMKSDSAKVEP